MRQLTVGEILDRAKMNLGKPRDNQFALAMGWSRQRVSVWRKGDVLPRTEELTHLALVAKVTPQQVMDAVYRAKMQKFTSVASWILVPLMTLMADFVYYVKCRYRFMAQPLHLTAG